MDDSGISIINVGFPALYEGERNNVKKIVNETFKNSNLTASAHANKESVDACLECGIEEVTIEMPFNGLNLKNRLRMSKEEALKSLVNSIEYTQKHNVNVNFVLIDGSRTPIEDIIECFTAAANAGATKLVLADSVGFLRPLSMRYLMSKIRIELAQKIKKEIALCIHCHNAFGLATANTLAAVEEGAVYLHTCIAGFGERAGIAPFEEVVAALELLYNIDTGVDQGRIYRLAQTAEKAFALPIQFHKPIIGDAVFTHEIDQALEEMQSTPMLYEPFPPEIVGRSTSLFIGRNTGQALIQQILEKAGIRASPRQIDELFRRIRGPQESLDKGESQITFYQIKKLMKELQKGYTMNDFWRLVQLITRQKPNLKDLKNKKSKK